MKNPVTDITNCDREPIHVPGQIQGHGFLIAVNKIDFTIQYISENLLRLAGLNPTELLGKTVTHFLEESNIIQLQTVSLQQLLNYAGEAAPETINPVSVKINNASYYLIAHVYNNYLILEFEPRKDAADVELQRLITTALSKILDGKTLKNVLQNAARQV